MGKHTKVLSHGLVVYITLVLVAGKFTFAPHPRGGRPLGSGRQLPPQLTVGQRPLGGGGGGGGGHLRGVFREGEWGGGYRRGWGGGSGRVGWGGGVQVGQFGVVGGGVQVGRFGVLGGGGHRLPLPPLALL